MSLDEMVKSRAVPDDCLKGRHVEARDVDRERMNFHRIHVGIRESGVRWYSQVANMRIWLQCK